MNNKPLYDTRISPIQEISIIDGTMCGSRRCRWMEQRWRTADLLVSVWLPLTSNILSCFRTWHNGHFIIADIQHCRGQPILCFLQGMNRKRSCRSKNLVHTSDKAQELPSSKHSSHKDACRGRIGTKLAWARPTFSSLVFRHLFSNVGTYVCMHAMYAKKVNRICMCIPTHAYATEGRRHLHGLNSKYGSQRETAGT